MKILFICSSNVCRSPFCELVFKRMVENDPELSARVESVKSAAVLNKSRRLHKMAFVSLSSRGFDDGVLRAFHPSYVWFDGKLFRDADMIIGMTAAHRVLLPFWYRKKFCLLSEAAGNGKINIPDPFLKKEQSEYEKVMTGIEKYLVSFADRIKKDEFSR